ncbi:SIR2-like domain-containing protein [Pantoea sesami]|nr:SIR2-like domain-containing protein [Pantoea sesami]
MEKLNSIFSQDDTILFIGSGVSLWSGLPSWSRLIEELADFIEQNGNDAKLVRSEAMRGDLLQAASYGFDQLTKHQMGEFIRKACRYGYAKPHDIHHKIISLGPSCFITTNYDDLIEQSLRKWQPEIFYRPPITNRHLTETAEIVHARATNFIFKPHGDASDSESIILTREQYRLLSAQGERHSALESVKMLLASRPVVYIGFGLRDPDFIYLRDLLANIYKGGTRDHYAIMADVNDSEIAYWRKNYGIHLINYTTTENADNSRNHQQLLDLLDKSIANSHQRKETEIFETTSFEMILSLARHASSMMHVTKSSPEFTIRVNQIIQKKVASNRYDLYNDNSVVNTFLDSGPRQAIIIGLPGSGKSYSLKQAAAMYAERLHHICLADEFDTKLVTIPIFADLKLYSGNLKELINQTLPRSLDINNILKTFKLKIFLDSFNEMPRDFLESGKYELDFQQFIQEFESSAIIISSRTSDGLDKLNFPIYNLNQIDKVSVDKELLRLGFKVAGRFSYETYQLIQRPFYFRLIENGSLALDNETHPRDFFKKYFSNVNNDFFIRFGFNIHIEKILSPVAYNALNRGEEIFPTINLINAFSEILEHLNVEKTSSQDIANWLISKSLILPYIGGKIGFIHQSITEYLAATELSRLYINDRNCLKDKIRLTRWDQSLFLTLSLLDDNDASTFLKDVINADYCLSLEAAKYIEIGRDEIVEKLLENMLNIKEKNFNRQWNIASSLEFKLPLNDVHVPQLKQIIEKGDTLGGAAVKRLVEIKGSEVKDYVLNLLIHKRNDFNLCRNGIAPALKPFITKNDAETIVKMIDLVQDNNILDDDCYEDEFSGLVSGASEIFSHLDLSEIKEYFIPKKSAPLRLTLRTKILCEILSNHHTNEALNIAADLLLLYPKQLSITIFFIVKFGDESSQLSWDKFTLQHIMILMNYIEKDDGDDKKWSLDTLQYILQGRDDLANKFKEIIASKEMIIQAVYLTCLNNNTALLFDIFKRLIDMEPHERKTQKIFLLNGYDIDWSSQEQLFLEILETRDKNLVGATFSASLPTEIKNLAPLHINNILWILEWLQDLTQQRNSDDYQFIQKLGSFFGKHTDGQTQGLFMDEFNKSESKYREIIHKFIFTFMENINIDAFSYDAINYLLDDLSNKNAVSSFHGHIIGRIASETFIDETLLPLLHSSDSILRENVNEILIQAGSRLGRRYLN